MPAEAAKASFNGARVGAFETRLNVEMTRLIERNGGAAFVAPSVREVTV
ncbi:MAG: uroporphyrinogen-III synthase, partial [Elusimicrobia bacterium]|nr:uroporphyrinogen-III synthase [Elusimicrobiota bacterium]